MSQNTVPNNNSPDISTHKLFLSEKTTNAFSKLKILFSHSGIFIVEALYTSTFTKVILKIFDSSCNFIDTIQREIKFHEQCKHDNIARLLRYYKDGKYYVMVLEHYETDLYNFIVNNGYLKLNHIINFTYNLLQALVCIHNTHGILHLDIKPENILINPSTNSIAITDFGLSVKKRSDLIIDKNGTLFYHSPEIVLGDIVSTKTDMWNLGIVIYIMITAESFTTPSNYKNAYIAELNHRFGPIPKKIIERSKNAGVIFDSEMKIICEKNFAHITSFTEQLTIMEKILLEENPTSKREVHCLLSLLKQLLSIDPDERPEAREALTHPLFHKWKSVLFS